MSTNVFSQAFNFSSAVQSGVDPRTGFFTFNFPVIQLTSNNSLGAALTLSLNYSPLQSEVDQDGLGKGFYLGGLATYDKQQHRLLLPTGEQYRTDETDSNVIIRQQKLDTVHIHKSITDLKTPYIVTTKSGETFRLAPAGADTYKTSRIESPLGYALSMTRKVINGAVRLTDITGDEGNVLCSIGYPTENGAPVSLTLWEGTPEQVTLSLIFQNGYLQTIKNTSLDDTPLVWQLGYTALPQGNLLTQVSSPTGLSESVKYDPAKLTLRTTQGEQKYPAVIQHMVRPGGESPAIQTLYDYSTDNCYLGDRQYIKDLQQIDDGVYELKRYFEYTSTEKQVDSQNQTLKTTTRTYNNFHVLVSEAILQDDCLCTRTTEYPIKKNFPFKDQPLTFLMPLTQTVTWKKGEQSRQEKTTFTYDTVGNLATHIAPDGVVTKYDYYPAAGDDGCPADPRGFTRYVKSRTITPPKSAEFGDEPTTTTTYRYKKFPTRPGSMAGYAVLQSIVTHSINGKSVAEETYTYNDESGLEYGRMKTRDMTRYSDTDGSKTYTSHQTFTFTLSLKEASLAQQVTTAVEDGHDVHTVTTSRTQSPYTGRLLQETDAAGNTVAYHYDPLGRLKQQTWHPDKPDYMASEFYTYTLPDTNQTGSLAQTVHTDIYGNLSRIDFDGLGREVTHFTTERDAVSENARGGAPDWQQLSQKSYDALGQTIHMSFRDVLLSDSQKAQNIEGFQKITWDSWGQKKAITGHDNVTAHQIIDPVAMTVTSWTSGEKTTDITGKQVVYYDTAHRPVKTELLTRDGKLYSTSTQVWDGAGRLRKTTDPLGYSTAYTYDIYGRVSVILLPDESTVKKQYVSFSSQPLITRISVTPKNQKEIILGTQQFDRLGRLKVTSSGGRTSTITYDYPWQRHPSTVTGPDGAAHKYISDPLLGEALTQVNASRDKEDITQIFGYDLKTGQMRQATEANVTNRWTPYPSGRLKNETLNICTDTGQQTEYGYSLSGVMQQNTDVTGGVQTRLFATEPKTAGQLKQIIDTDVTVTLHYDGLQRLAGWTATETATGNTLTTTLVFNDFGQEIKRTLTHSNGESHVITQTWTLNNQRRTRTRYHGNTLQNDEIFTYDERSRLKKYQADPKGEFLPQDSYGNPMVQQIFDFDALNNIITCTTTLKDNSENIAHYHFDNKNDPCQLTSVTNSLISKGYPAEILLKYDAAGRMEKDEAGRVLTYDALGRLKSVKGDTGSGSYGYDAGNRLVYQQIDKTQQLHRLYYRGNTLVNEWITPQNQQPDAKKDTRVRLISAAGANVAQVNLDGEQHAAMLTGTDGMHSVLTASEGNKTLEYCYTPYGYQTTDEPETREEE